MKSISTLAVIGLLFFACKLCSLTGNRNQPVASSTPIPLMYARDFIKPQIGSFSLVKSYTKEEAQRTASGFTIEMIEKSNDAAGGEYKSSGGSVALMACNYASTTTPSLLVDEIEAKMRADRVWKTVRTIPQHNGKRVEGQDGRGNGLVIWNNGYWLFMTIGDNPANVSSLATSVGY